MALAPYVDKITQSASSLLAGFGSTTFKAFLNTRRVALAFDTAVGTEARFTLDLALDLLARLYPAVDVISLSGSEVDRAIAVELLATARRINPAIEGGDSFASDTCAALVIGTKPAPWNAGDTPTIYIGSDGWLARAATDHPVGSGRSTNPFGASAAACIGAANVFRAAFAAQLRQPELDRNLTISLIDYELGSGATRNPQLPAAIDIGETFLVGVGAIGHGAVWAWRRTAGLRGKLHLVDNEDYDETNPQRYVATTASPGRNGKVSSVASLLESGASRELTTEAHQQLWDQYLAQRGDWHLERVALALDSAEDRTFAQASLPKRIYNSWTQADNLGVSRHDFLNTACVACLYQPRSERPDLDDIVASALNFRGDQELQLVRLYLDTHRPLELAMIAKIAQQVGVDINVLLPFVGAPLITLYHRAACGGRILEFGGQLGDALQQVEVPMAFQSAMAGILLAAEVVIDASGLRPIALPVRTEIDLLNPLVGTLCSPESKSANGRCICQDPDFLRAYRAKYVPNTEPS